MFLIVNKEMEYDIPCPIYIPYIGPYNVPLGVICQGRVVTCFSAGVHYGISTRVFVTFFLLFQLIGIT